MEELDDIMEAKLMVISEYRSIDNRLNVLINSVDKMLHLEIISIHDLEFVKLKRNIVAILKKLFDDNNLSEKYIEKFNQIISFYYEQTEVNFNKSKESLRQLIYEAIEEVNKVYFRNFKFISNCSLPYLTYVKALKLYKIFSQKLASKRAIITELFN